MDEAVSASGAVLLLPPALTLHVFGLLPVDARACAACVSRAWCSALADWQLWTRLDLSPSSGVRVFVNDTVLLGATAKARSQLVALDVSDCEYLSRDALLTAVRTHGGTLRELRCGASVDTYQTLDTDALRRLLQAAPLLTVCEAALLGACNVPEVRRMLRGEPPFEQLRLRALCVNFVSGHRRTREETANSRSVAVIGLAAELGTHAWLKQLALINAYKNDHSADEDAVDDASATAAIDAVVDAALVRGLESIRFVDCKLIPDFLPALARLVNGGTLTSLTIVQHHYMFDAPSMALFADAVRASSALTTLVMCGLVVHGESERIPVLLGALTGHHSMRTLCILGHFNGQPCGTDEMGGTLGALVAANARALTELDVSQMRLGDAVVRPLLDALAVNTHLRVLNISDNDLSADFSRDVLLPAIHANTGLRQLSATQWGFDPPNDNDCDRARSWQWAELAVAQRLWEEE